MSDSVTPGGGAGRATGTPRFLVLGLSLVAIVLIAALVGCKRGGEPEATPTGGTGFPPAQNPTASLPLPTETPAAVATPASEATQPPAATPTPAAIPTEAPTATPVATATPEPPAATATPEPPAATATPVATATPESTPVPTATPTPVGRQTTVTLAMRAVDGQEGSATISEVGSNTVIKITVSPPVEVDPQPAYFQMTDCTSIGPVSIKLQPVMNGESETTLEMAYDTIVGEKRWLAVTRSENGVWVLTACGELSGTPG